MPASNTPRPPVEIISHWYALVEGVHFSPSEFYRSLESEIGDRKLPRLNISRVDILEGSAVSDKRTYLRFMRERYAFDICAAPFGKDYFFSMRFLEVPRPGWFPLIATLTTFVMLFLLYPRKYVPSEHVRLWWTVVAAGFFWITYRAYLPGKGTAPGVKDSWSAGPDIDGFLLSLPLIGPYYERHRSDTYYRYDTRLVFHTIVSETVKRKVDELIAAKGVRIAESFEYSPMMKDMYASAHVAAPIR